MSEIIQFPVSNKLKSSDLEAVINDELKSIPKKDREKLRFELIKTIDSYDAFFTEWSENKSTISHTRNMIEKCVC